VRGANGGEGTPCRWGRKTDTPYAYAYRLRIVSSILRELAFNQKMQYYNQVLANIGFICTLAYIKC